MVNLDAYRRRVEEIKRYGIENNVPISETNKMFKECFYVLEAVHSRRSSNLIKTLKIIISSILILILSSISLYNHPSTHSLLLRNMQNFIYPGLKVFRTLAVPIIARYPSLTGWYDEWCLLENPYFRVNEMDCWPCSSIHSVPDLTGHNITVSFNVGIPYTRMETNSAVVNMNDLFEIYQNNQKIFDENANRVSSNNPMYRTIKDVLYRRMDIYSSRYQTSHVSWRINRMKPGRLLRKLFPRSVEIPAWWGQSTEKYIFIDEPKSPAYSLPNPECSNIMIRCTNGERLIRMVPSPECRQKCRSSTIMLSAHHSLWYNWWYWRPVSLPVANSTVVSINYLTSFC